MTRSSAGGLVEKISFKPRENECLGVLQRASGEVERVGGHTTS